MKSLYFIFTLCLSTSCLASYDKEVYCDDQESTNGYYDYLDDDDFHYCDYNPDQEETISPCDWDSVRIVCAASKTSTSYIPYKIDISCSSSISCMLDNIDSQDQFVMQCYNWDPFANHKVKVGRIQCTNDRADAPDAEHTDVDTNGCSYTGDLA
jgi:hypothetical protein